MKYIIIIYGNSEAWDALAERDIDELAGAHAALKRDLRTTGEYVDSSEIDENSATVLSSETGAITQTDGPLINGQFILSGYYIIDCEDMSRAIEVARRFAEVKFAPIEVRRLGEGSTWTEQRLQR